MPAVYSTKGHLPKIGVFSGTILRRNLLFQRIISGFQNLNFAKMAFDTQIINVAMFNCHMDPYLHSVVVKWYNREYLDESEVPSFAAIKP